MEASADKTFADMLLARGAVQATDLERARQIQQSAGGNLGALLVGMGALSEDALLRHLAEHLGVVYLRDDGELPDHQAVYRHMAQSAIKLDWLLDNEVVLWPAAGQSDGAGEDGSAAGEGAEAASGGLCCAARDVQSRVLLETLNYFHPGERIDFCLLANHQLDRLLEYVRKEREMESLFSGDDAKRLRELAEEAPIIALVNNLLAQAVDLGASDIHIEPSEEQFLVRMRVDGILHSRLTQPIERFPAVASRVKLIAGLDIAERRRPQDGRIGERISGKEMDIRVSTVPCAFGESIVLRLLAQERGDLSLANLGMAPDHLQLFRGWLATSNGIALVTGPTGSGKSTTLAAALEEVDDGVKKIITVEDPVEYQMPSITQIQVHAEIGYTFATALRHILRQDPDVIMIGEMRDLETSEIAIRSALTGHVVLSTLHTNDAVSSFTRLIDMGVEPFLVAAPTRGVQAQRLVRQACPKCATPTRPSALVEDLLSGVPADLAGGQWLRTEGCPACQHTGFRGRLGIYELVPMSQEMQEMIVSGAHLNDLRRFAHKEQGHRTLLQDGLLKASHGTTTTEEVLRLTLTEDGAREGAGENG